MADDHTDHTGKLRWRRAAAAGLALCLAASAAQPLLFNLPPWWAHPNHPIGGVTAIYLAYASLVFMVNAVGLNQELSWLVAIARAVTVGNLAQIAVCVVFCVVGVFGAGSATASDATTLLLIPGVLGFLLLNAVTDDAKAQIAKQELDWNAIPDVDDIDEDDGDVSGRRWTDVFQFYVVSLAFVLLVAVAIRTHWFLGGALLTELVSGEAATAQLWADLANQDAWLNVLGAVSTGAAVVLVGLTLVVAVFAYFYRVGDQTKQGPLSAEEIAYLDAAEKRLIAYARQHGLAQMRWVEFLYPVAIFMGLAGGVALAYLVAGDLSAAAEAARVPVDAAWSIYQSHWFGAGYYIASAAVVILMSALGSFVLRLFPRLGEAWVWTQIYAADQTILLRATLKWALRSGTLRVGRTFDPTDFLRQRARGGFKTLLLSLVTAAIAAIVLRLDYADYDLVTPDKIVTVYYWTSTERAHAYTDVAGIEVRCQKTAAYRLILRSGDVVGIRVWAGAHERLDALTIIDDRFRAAGVKVAFATNTPWFEAYEVSYRDDCVRGLVEGLPPDRAAQIERILHWDAWRARSVER